MRSWSGINKPVQIRQKDDFIDIMLGMSIIDVSSGENNLPQSVNALLWSYNLDRIEVQKHKKIIIFQVLNLGSKEAIEWLFKQYGFASVEQIASTIPLFQWNKKSLSLWRLVLSINPKNRIT